MNMTSTDLEIWSEIYSYFFINKMPRFIQDHLRNIPTSYRDRRSQRAKFRREDFWRPMALDLIVRLLPLWLARVQKCRERPVLDFGEMVTSSEEVGYHLMLVGPELDFYLKVISKTLYRLLGLSQAYHMLLEKSVCLRWSCLRMFGGI